MQIHEPSSFNQTDELTLCYTFEFIYYKKQML